VLLDNSLLSLDNLRHGIVKVKELVGILHIGLLLAYTAAPKQRKRKKEKRNRD
jgi:hypothetical protein